MPHSESDLRQYSKNSNYKFLNEILETLEPSEMLVHLPKFRFECTSRAEKALGKVVNKQTVTIYSLSMFRILAWNHDTFHIES